MMKSNVSTSVPDVDVGIIWDLAHLNRNENIDNLAGILYCGEPEIMKQVVSVLLAHRVPHEYHGLSFMLVPKKVEDMVKLWQKMKDIIEFDEFLDKALSER